MFYMTLILFCQCFWKTSNYGKSLFTIFYSFETIFIRCRRFFVLFIEQSLSRLDREIYCKITKTKWLKLVVFWTGSLVLLSHCLPSTDFSKWVFLNFGKKFGKIDNKIFSKCNTLKLIIKNQWICLIKCDYLIILFLIVVIYLCDFWNNK